MQFGAVIVAAGMSSRMGDFKPMLNIGSISIAQRVVATLRQSGVTRIVMVTGHNAQELERHLANNGLVFLRNEQYRTTQMFDSAKIGLEYMKNKCDGILFTPVDIPLFTASTVSALMTSGASLACPVCSGRHGHPILISSRLVDTLLAYRGEGGLGGAIEHCGTEMTEIPVEDIGVLHDADTPDDYRALLDYHNKQLVRPITDVALAKEKVFFDQKLAMLLTITDETKSVRTACKRIQISYSTGWNIIRRLETELGRAIVERSQGGLGGGQSTLTRDGRLLLERYNEFKRRLREQAEGLFQDCFGDVL